MWKQTQDLEVKRATYHQTTHRVTNTQNFYFTNTEPSLLNLLHELHPVCASWYNIGLELGIPYNTLDCFKQNYTDQLVLMREILKHWLKTAVSPRPTWEAVVTALRSPLVNEMSVAAQLEAKYCAPIQHLGENPTQGKCSANPISYQNRQ